MPSDGSVTHWIGLAKAGDSAAAQPLWERYFQRLVGLARHRLAGLPRGAADEEDVALSALNHFFKDARKGRFPQLSDRNDLWRLLVTITAHKTLDLARHQNAQKRGRPLQGERAEAALEQVLGNEPSPEFAAQVADEMRRLLDVLPDAELRSIALWRMEGDSPDEIAKRLGCVPRTVHRRLGLIRSLWSH
jgi:DNA-directed RNA polymerase specialized sigma24 family protein